MGDVYLKGTLLLFDYLLSSVCEDHVNVLNFSTLKSQSSVLETVLYRESPESRVKNNVSVCSHTDTLEKEFQVHCFLLCCLIFVYRTSSF